MVVYLVRQILDFVLDLLPLSQLVLEIADPGFPRLQPVFEFVGFVSLLDELADVFAAA